MSWLIIICLFIISDPLSHDTLYISFIVNAKVLIIGALSQGESYLLMLKPCTALLICSTYFTGASASESSSSPRGAAADEQKCTHHRSDL